MSQATHEDAVDDDPPAAAPAKRSILASPWTNLATFLLTVVSTFYVGAQLVDGGSPLRGWIFAVPLLAILVTHELGHYLQARRYGVDTSLPYFIPFPLPPLGTLGAVIAMRGRIKTRDALFDIGAWGPFAGLIVAIPILVVGLLMSKVGHVPWPHGWQRSLAKLHEPHSLDEGQSLFYLLLKRIVLGRIPPGEDVLLHATAFAGWCGLFMTMLNLIPVGQLDGGHVAYALFGTRQDRYSKYVHHALLAVAVGVGLLFASRSYLAHHDWKAAMKELPTGANWIVWWVFLLVITKRSGGAHPTTDDASLSRGRRIAAWATLALFVFLFMPVVMTDH